jgi:hypothetical protein
MVAKRRFALWLLNRVLKSGIEFLAKPYSIRDA